MPSAPFRPTTNGWRALWALLGASTGFADFYLRHPEELAHLAGVRDVSAERGGAARGAAGRRSAAVDGFAADGGESSWVRPAGALPPAAGRDRRVRPAERLAGRRRSTACRRDWRMPRVPRWRRPSASPAPACRAARREQGSSPASRSRPPAWRSSGWARRGARELNYVSDVDVIFVAGADRCRPGATSARAASSTSRPGWRCRRCAASPASRSSPRCGRSMRTCGPRASRARSCAHSIRTCPTTTGGRRAGSSRPCSRRGRSPATPSSATPTCAPSSRRSGPVRRARTSSTTCSGCASESPSTSRRRTSRTSSSSGPAASATSSSRCSCCSSSTA